jgi:hypothetical protein
MLERLPLPVYHENPRRKRRSRIEKRLISVERAVPSVFQTGLGKLYPLGRQAGDPLGRELLVTEPKTKNSVRKAAVPKQTMELLMREHEQPPDNPILFPSPRTGGCWSSGAVSRINKKTAEGGGNR